jgi:hypothetical protein
MSPIIVTLAQAGGYVAQVAPVAPVAPVTPVPPVAPAAGVSIPEARQQAGAYFQLFKPCSCGHSSAWHSGSFGPAWRAGEQVAGGCEAANEVSSGSCACRGFQAADLPG